MTQGRLGDSRRLVAEQQGAEQAPEAMQGLVVGEPGLLEHAACAAGAVAAMVVSPFTTPIVPAVKPFAVAVIFIAPEAPSCFTTQRHFPLNAACVLPESFSTFAP